MPLLTQPELRELTGCVHKTRQRRVLDQRGIGYLVRADGSIATTWEAVNAALCGKVVDNDPELSFDWMNQ